MLAESPVLNFQNVDRDISDSVAYRGRHKFLVDLYSFRIVSFYVSFFIELSAIFILHIIYIFRKVMYIVNIYSEDRCTESNVVYLHFHILI